MAGRRMSLTARELRGQLIVLAAILWTMAVVNTSTSTRFLRSGQIKGTDFVQFYTLGRLAAEGHVGQFDDAQAIRRAQLSAVPQSGDVWLPPVYGPQVALALSPLGHVSYDTALVAWVALTAVVYFALIALVVRHAGRLRDHVRLTILAAAAFPPFYQLVQHGQLTAYAMAAVVAAWLALRSGREIAAGAALGLLAYKPPLVAPVLAVLLLAGAWRMLVPALFVGVAQALVAGWWVGVDGLKRSVALLTRLPDLAPWLNTRPEQAHGLKAFWALLIPNPTVAMVLYALTAALALVLAARLWRRQLDPTLRMATLVLATVLAAPYLFVYDLTIVAPAWIWLTDWFLARRVPAIVGRALYVGYCAPLLAPFVPFVRVQLTIPCFAILLFTLWRFRDAPVQTEGRAEARPSI